MTPHLSSSSHAHQYLLLDCIQHVTCFSFLYNDLPVPQLDIVTDINSLCIRHLAVLTICVHLVEHTCLINEDGMGRYY